MRRENKGFTLIEVVVVMGVLAVLMALATPAVTRYMKDTKVITMRSDIATITREMATADIRGNAVNTPDEITIDKINIEKTLKTKKDDKTKVELTDFGMSDKGKVIFIEGKEDSGGVMQHGAEDGVTPGEDGP